VIIKPKNLNAGPYHLIRIETRKKLVNLDDNFPDAQLFSIKMVDVYFEEIV